MTAPLSSRMSPTGTMARVPSGGGSSSAPVAEGQGL
ncbi:Uncharacterised protein [Mycobacteroides abscessus subsp. abscessus]|nr:Uncharacterised protein [Mycobacteroides abscessus subsp. abscessus]